MDQNDPIDIALRVYTESLKRGRRRDSRKNERIAGPWRPERVLFLDCETTTDEAQRLTFGFYRYCRIEWQNAVPTLHCVEEGIVHADDLPERDAKGFACLQRFVATHPADVHDLSLPKQLQLRSQDKFLYEILYMAAYRARAVCVGFNLPYDLSRLARHAGNARASRKRGDGDDAASTTYRGGFSFSYWGHERDGVWRDRPSMPRVAIKAIDSKRALIGFVTPKGGRYFPGHFLDLRTLAFALTDRGHSLESACKAFGIIHGKERVERHGVIDSRYVAYARRDVLATSELFTATITEFLTHPIDLDPTKAFSSASIGKAYLRAMGIAPILDRQPDFPKEVLGIGMNAYFGGRAECRIRKEPVPVRYCDFRSMYPTVCAQMGIWDLLTAEQIEVRDATTDVRTMLGAVTAEQVFDRSFWKNIVGFVEIEPDGDVLPVRGRYDRAGQSWQIGLNPVTSGPALWISIVDAVDSVLLSGKSPKVIRAIRLAPKGRLANLRPVLLGGRVKIDPRKTDFFKTVIEERVRVLQSGALDDSERVRLDRFLKTLANATSYGSFAELIRRDLPVRETEPVRVFNAEETFDTRTSAPEDPGAYYFGPIAAVITGAARLMLGLLERTVADAGGVHAFADTDSLAIVATKGGDKHATIPRLSWDEVEMIRARFRQLSPYDRDLVGDLLKLEDENSTEPEGRSDLQCSAISAKRYALFRRDERGEPVLVKHSEHGLGHLLDPLGSNRQQADWIQETWIWLVRRELGRLAHPPSWFGRPAVGQITVSSPTLWRPFDQINHGRSYDESVKPFNFILTTHVAPFGHPNWVEPERFHLIAPHETDPAKWIGLLWIDCYSGKHFDVTTSGLSGGPGFARVKRYGELCREYELHREHKSLAPDGSFCGPLTRGLLRRRPVEIGRIRHIGKEANELDLREAGVHHDLAQTLSSFDAPWGSEWLVSTGWMQTLSTAQLVRITGRDRSTVKRWKRGSASPGRMHRDQILARIRAQRC